jgi:hypothetical protein
MLIGFNTKTLRLAMLMCSLSLPALALGAFTHASVERTDRKAFVLRPVAFQPSNSVAAALSTEEDPIGDWLEKNADRFGMVVDRPPRGKKIGSRLKISAEPPAVAVPPSGAASSPQTTQTSQPLETSETSSPVRVIEFPRAIMKGEPFAALPIVKPDLGPNFQITGQQGAVCGYAPCASETPIADGLTTAITSDYVVDRKVFAPPVEATVATDPAAQISAVMKDLKFANKCSGFATATGFGSWGKAVIKELLHGNANSLLQGTDDLRRACPNYDFLTIPEKSHVWVSVLASMSFLESSCDPGVEGNGPDGTAAGLMQLHAGNEQKAAPGCSRNDSRSPIKSLRCTISIIETQIKRTSSLFSRDTHFGVLRPQGDLIRTRTGALKRIVKARIIVGGIKELPFCQRK